MNRSPSHHQLRRFVSRVLLATGALALSGAAFAAGKPLFTGTAQVQPSAMATANRMASRPDTSTMRVLRADASVVSPQTREIELDLGLRRVNAVLEQTQDSATGSLVWIGHVRETAKARPATAREVRHDAMNSVILVRRGDGVTGNVRVDGKLFRIQTIAGTADTALIEVNEDKRPPDHPSAFGDLPNIAMPQAPSGRVGALAIDPGATATIRVLVVATNAAVSA